MGTLGGYSPRVAKSRYTPPTPEVEAHVERVVGLFERRQQIEDEYKKALGELISDDKVPIAYIAEKLDVERKTVYRHLGRSMS